MSAIEDQMKRLEKLSCVDVEVDAGDDQVGSTKDELNAVMFSNFE